MISRVIKFLTTDIWRVRLKDYSRSKSFLIRQLQIIVLAVRGYNEDKCKFRASALTFFSLLSIVPVIALMFGIAKGFGFQKKVESAIVEKLTGHEEIAQRLINFSNSLLENAKGGVIAGIGVVFLLWAVIKLLSSIENSFNEIWGVKKGRHIGRKFSDYISVVLVCPILLAISSSANVIISTQVKLIISKLPIFDSVSWLILLSLRILPYCTVWLIFTFVFIFMPNTKVRFRSSLIAGIAAGTIFQFVQWGYIRFQIGAARYGAIYGSFAALPLFLMWLQISWLIVLFGAEISFAHQNVDTYEFEPDCLSVSYSFKRLLSLLVSELLVKNFCRGERAFYAAEISHKLEIPIRLVREILYELVGAGILIEVRREQDKDAAYQPGCDSESLTIKYVIDALEQRGVADIPVVKSGEFDKLTGCLKEFGDLIEKSPANMPLKNI